MQLVVVIAVRNAVSAATITFTTVSRKSFLFIVFYFFSTTDSTDSTDIFLYSVNIEKHEIIENL